MYMIYFYYRNYKSVGEKMKLNSKNISFIKYFSALLLFGTNGIVASLIDLESNQIVLYRTFLGSLILFAIFLITRNKFSFFRHKKDFFFLCLSGISMGASWLFLYEGVQSNRCWNIFPAVLQRSCNRNDFITVFIQRKVHNF